MLQIQYIRENKENVTKALEKRNIQNVKSLIDEVLLLDDERKNIQLKADESASNSNAYAKKIGALMKEGKIEAAEEAKKQASFLRDEKDALKTKQKELEEKLKSKLLHIPNAPNEIVPLGKSEEDNVVVFEGEKTLAPNGGKPHWDLIVEYDLVDFELGNKITGSGFPVYKAKGARLQRALANFFLDQAIEAGYNEIIPPLLVNEESGLGTGQLPDKDGQMYQATADNLYLIPTSEVPLMNVYRDVILSEADLPVKNVAHSQCFRREAGSWGAHVRGLNRLHQFEKVEIVQVTKPEDSYAALEDMKSHVENLLIKLELPYRILNLCGGDLGVTAAITYDFEVFSAAQNKWLEVSSVSNCETYQATRLKLRYKDAEKKTNFVHTLNGSALALPRILASILENNQDAEGIKVPEALVTYTGFDRIA